ncbi:hypothetical protein ABG768_010227, partial [Culter alburnus]
MLIPPHVLLALSKHGRSGTVPGHPSPHPPLQPTHSSSACSFTRWQTPGHLSLLVPCITLQNTSNPRRNALYYELE